ncbi:hypothetical protein A2U01_0115255, partial [Trifolium medium]|nr:hypothetical protein [Trifolium medium]
MARCAVLLRMLGDSSVICASRRQRWRVAPTNGKDSWRASVNGASRRKDGALRQAVRIIAS